MPETLNNQPNGFLISVKITKGDNTTRMEMKPVDVTAQIGVQD